MIRFIALSTLLFFCSTSFSKTIITKPKHKRSKLILNLEGGFIYPNQTKLIESIVGQIPGSSIYDRKLKNLGSYTAGFSFPIIHNFLLSINYKKITPSESF